MGSLLPTPYQRLIEFQQLTEQDVAPRPIPIEPERPGLADIARHWKPVASLTAVGLLLALAAIAVQKSVYRAQAVIELRVPADEELETQLHLLESDALLWTAAVKANLLETSEYANLAREATLERLHTNLAAKPMGQTHIVEITFEANNSKASADFATQVVQSYRELMLGRRMVVVRQNVSFLESQIEERQARANAAQTKLRDFVRTQSIERESIAVLRLRSSAEGPRYARLLRAQLAHQAGAEVERHTLELDFDQQRTAYNGALRQYREANLQASATAADNMLVLDTAHEPESPVRPRKWPTILLGTLAGLFAGLIVSFRRSARDRKIDAHARASAALGTPQLGVAPPAWIDAVKTEPRSLSPAESRGRYALWNFHNPDSAHADM